VIGGHLHIADDESLELRFFGAGELPDLPADQMQGVKHGLSGNRVTLFVSPAADAIPQ
jgi:hypothetical protein